MSEDSTFNVAEAVKAFFERFARAMPKVSLAVDRDNYNTLGDDLHVCLEQMVSPDETCVYQLIEPIAWAQIPDDWTIPATCIKLHCESGEAMATHVADHLDTHFKKLQIDIAHPRRAEVTQRFAESLVESVEELGDVCLDLNVRVPALSYASQTDAGLPLAAFLPPDVLAYVWRAAAPPKIPFRHYF